MAGPEFISGAMVHSHLAELERRFTRARLATIIDGLTPEDQDHLRLVTPLTWIRIDVLERAYEAFAREARTDVETLHTRIASEVVGRTVTSIWRVVLRIANDDLLIARAPAIFKRSYQQGSVTVTRSSPGKAELRVADWPDISEFALRGMRVGIESTLRAAGRKNPRGSAARVRDGAILRFEWDV